MSFFTLREAHYAFGRTSGPSLNRTGFRPVTVPVFTRRLHPARDTSISLNTSISDSRGFNPKKIQVEISIAAKSGWILSKLFVIRPL